MHSDFSLRYYKQYVVNAINRVRTKRKFRANQSINQSKSNISDILDIAFSSLHASPVLSTRYNHFIPLLLVNVGKRGAY